MTIFTFCATSGANETAAHVRLIPRPPPLPRRHVWEKGGAAIEVSASPRLRQEADGTLHISQTWSGDIGTYTCRVTSVGGNDSRSAHLRVRSASASVGAALSLHFFCIAPTRRPTSPHPPSPYSLIHVRGPGAVMDDCFPRRRGLSPLSSLIHQSL